MKQLAAYYCMGTPGLEARLKEIQRSTPTGEGFDAYLDSICSIIMEDWTPGGLRTATFINHMTLTKRKKLPNVSSFASDKLAVTERNTSTVSERTHDGAPSAGMVQDVTDDISDCATDSRVAADRECSELVA
jgi:hypothetical protein